MNSFNLNELYSAATHIPIFVWFILAYLLYVGFSALKPRVISFNRLIFIPLALILLKYKAFTSEHVWLYLLTLVVGLLIGFYKVKNDQIEILKEIRSIKIPASYSLIFVLVGLFVLKFYFGYLQASNPEAYAQKAIWEYSISGILSGYFSGQRASYAYRYWLSFHHN